MKIQININVIGYSRYIEAAKKVVRDISAKFIVSIAFCHDYSKRKKTKNEKLNEKSQTTTTTSSLFEKCWYSNFMSDP